MMIGAEGMDLQGFRGLFAGDVLLYGMRGSVRAARGNGSVPFRRTARGPSRRASKAFPQGRNVIPQGLPTFA